MLSVGNRMTIVSRAILPDPSQICQASVRTLVIPGQANLGLGNQHSRVISAFDLALKVRVCPLAGEIRQRRDRGEDYFTWR